MVAFQKTFGLDPDGVVGRLTWQDMYRAYRGIIDSMEPSDIRVALYPGTVSDSVPKGNTSVSCRNI